MKISLIMPTEELKLNTFLMKMSVIGIDILILCPQFVVLFGKFSRYTLAGGQGH